MLTTATINRPTVATTPDLARTAAIYCRVSSEEQGKKNKQAESLPAQ
jgi:hypothetical protein